MPIGTSDGEYYDTKIAYLMAQLDKPQVEQKDLPPPPGYDPNKLPDKHVDQNSPMQWGMEDILKKLGTVPDSSMDDAVKREFTNVDVGYNDPIERRQKQIEEKKRLSDKYKDETDLMIKDSEAIHEQDQLSKPMERGLFETLSGHGKSADPSPDYLDKNPKGSESIADRQGRGSDMEGPHPPKNQNLESNFLNNIGKSNRDLIELKPGEDIPDGWKELYTKDNKVTHYAIRDDLPFPKPPSDYTLSPKQLREKGILGEGEQPKEKKPRGPK